MKAKGLGIFVLAAMVVLVAMPLWAGTITVDNTDPGCVSGSGQLNPYAVVYCSIQDAIDDANSGDTINVAAGTYNEAVKVDKSLTLKGDPGAIIQPDDTTPKHDNGKQRCGIYVAGGVDDVTIEGFEIDGTVGPVHLGIFPLNSNNTVVKNNVVHHITNDPHDATAGVGILFFGWGQGIDGALIEGNTVYTTGRMGIIVCGMQSSWPWKWIVCSDNVIRNNTVHHAWQGPMDDYGGAVQINGAKNAVIVGNTIHDTGLDQWGIYICGSFASTPNSIEGNDIYSNPIGIVICSSDPGVDYGADSPGPPEVHFNCIHDNTAYGLYVYDVDSAYQVNAENNWWGGKRGPSRAVGKAKGHDRVKGDRVSANVRFAPWLREPWTPGSAKPAIASDVKPFVASSYSLSQSYPNPCNPETNISYSLAEPGPVTLKVYNLTGQLVRTLVDEVKASGAYAVRWDARDDSGALVASGVYFYRMVAGNYSQTRRMLMLR